MKKPVIIIGGGGHSKVLINSLKLIGREIIGITERNNSAAPILDVPIIGNDSAVYSFHPSQIELVNGLGSVSSVRHRAAIFDHFSKRGYQFSTVIHPAAIVASDAKLYQGVQIMAGAIVQPGCLIGKNTILNTRASVDHDCKIGSHVHIAPGVTLSGNVHIAEGVHIGTGAIVIQEIKIHAKSTVAAGAVVIRNVDSCTKVIGVPAKEVKL